MLNKKIIILGLSLVIGLSVAGQNTKPESQYELIMNAFFFENKILKDKFYVE